MKRGHIMTSHLGGFPSGGSLGNAVSRYGGKQNIYKQGATAHTLFYTQEGDVRLTTRANDQPSAVTAILGVDDFFGELCLAGYPLRVPTAVALTSSIRTINKEKMLELLRRKNKLSNSSGAYLLSSVKNYQDYVAHLLTSTYHAR